MQTQPVDVPDDLVVREVAAAWRIPITSATYLKVGYGSHHWLLTDRSGSRWFASVDELPRTDGDAEYGDAEFGDAEFRQLAAALGAAATARAAGRSFVVAPLSTADGDVVRRLGDRYAVALYPYVEGRSGNFGDRLSPADGAELTRLLVSLHRVDLAVGSAAAGPLGVANLIIPDRESLEASLRELDGGEWPGPYGHRLVRLISTHTGDLARALRQHDDLVEAAGPQGDRLVLTHGEPHPGNLIRTDDGLALVDWESARLAPPERDLWMVDVRTHGAASGRYEASTGRVVQPGLIARYKIAWALADVASYVELLRHVPGETADTRWSWDALEGTVHELADDRLA